MEIVSISNNKNIVNKNILTKFKQHSKMEIIKEKSVSNSTGSDAGKVFSIYLEEAFFEAI